MAETNLSPRSSGFRLQHEAAIAAVEKWTRVRHPGLIGVREAFTTRAFGDQCKHSDGLTHLHRARNLTFKLPPARSDRLRVRFPPVLSDAVRGAPVPTCDAAAESLVDAPHAPSSPPCLGLYRCGRPGCVRPATGRAPRSWGSRRCIDRRRERQFVPPRAGRLELHRADRVGAQVRAQQRPRDADGGCQPGPGDGQEPRPAERREHLGLLDVGRRAGYPGASGSSAPSACCPPCCSWLTHV